MKRASGLGLRASGGLLALAAACHGAKPEPVKPLPRPAYAHYLAGKAAMYRGDAAEAADELAAAAVAAPDQPMIVVEQARALIAAKHGEEAAQVLEKARAKWPRHPQVWLASGEIAERGGDAWRAQAIRAYRRTIELASDDERGYLGLARTLDASGDARGAEAALRSLVSRVPASVDGHYRLAQRLALRGDLAAATTELRAVLERDPDHIDARLDLARLLRRTGKLAEAIEQTRSAFDRAGQSLDIAEELFWLLCDADDLTGAIDLLTLLDDDRSDAEALATVARLDIGLGRFPQALSIADRVAAMDRDVEAMIRVAVAVATHDVAAAEHQAAAVPESSRAFANVRRLAADALLASGEPQRAFDLLAPVHRAHPEELEPALLSAMALADLQRTDDAAAVLAMAKADAARVTLARARLAEHRGDKRGAVALLVPLLRDHPDNASALNLAGYLLAQLHEHFDDAERYLRHAHELAPGEPSVLDSLGWLLLQRGDTKAAVRTLDQAARLAPGEPEILVHLAEAVAADGNAQKAAEILDRASALHPYRQVADRIAALRSTLAPRR